MDYHHTYSTQRPRQPPRPHDPENRIELNVLRLDADGNSIYDGENNEYCDCFPRTSKKTIPSMLYDRIKCPHHCQKHIQPAQQSVFTYPWTASSDKNYRQRDNHYDGGLSTIGEDDEIGLDDPRGTPKVTRTAPPFASMQTTSRWDPPFTAPVQGDTRLLNPVSDFQRAASVPSLTSYAPPSRQMSRQRSRQGSGQYQTLEPGLDPTISTPYVDYSNPAHGFERKKRPFVGHYTDPKNGRVYKFNVKLEDGSAYGKESRVNSKRQQTPVVR